MGGDTLKSKSYLRESLNLFTCIFTSCCFLSLFFGLQPGHCGCAGFQRKLCRESAGKH